MMLDGSLMPVAQTITSPSARQPKITKNCLAIKNPLKQEFTFNVDVNCSLLDANFCVGFGGFPKKHYATYGRWFLCAAQEQCAPFAHFIESKTATRAVFRTRLYL